MQRFRLFSRALVLVASWNLVLPVPSTWAGESSGADVSSRKPVIDKDVRLSDDGALRGQLTDQQGRPLGDRPVAAVRVSDRRTTSTQTDARGEFTLHGLRGGVYQLRSAGSEELYRVWANGTSPPAAVDRILLVDDDRGVQRGQNMCEFLTNPLVLGAAVAAAIAIPVALHNSKSDKRPGS